MWLEKPGKKEPQSYSPVLLCCVWSRYTFNHGMIIEAYFSNPKSKFSRQACKKLGFCGK